MSNSARTTDAFHWDQLPALPDRHGVAGAFAGVSGDALIVAGGANFPEKMPWDGGTKAYHDAIFVLTAPDGAWRTGFRLPRPLAYGVSVSTTRGLVCVGGCDATRCYNDAFLIKWNGSEIAIDNLPSLPRPLVNACGAVIGDTIYVAGGEEAPGATAASNRFWALDLGDPSPRWRELATWPGPPRSLAFGGVLGGRFVLIGGVELSADASGRPARRYLKDAFAYSPESAGWTRLADLPHPIAAGPAPAPVVNGELLILGGDDGSKVGFAPPAQHPGFSNRILAYDGSADRWRVAGDVPAPRATVAAVPWRGRIAVPSGEVGPGVRSPQVWSLTGPVAP